MRETPRILRDSAGFHRGMWKTAPAQDKNRLPQAAQKNVNCLWNLPISPCGYMRHMLCWSQNKWKRRDVEWYGISPPETKMWMTWSSRMTPGPAASGKNGKRPKGTTPDKRRGLFLFPDRCRRLPAGENTRPLGKISYIRKINAKNEEKATQNLRRL